MFPGIKGAHVIAMVTEKMEDYFPLGKEFKQLFINGNLPEYHYFSSVLHWYELFGLFVFKA
ncbi:MAG: hypothetical protein A4E52_01589 [Pelotomaculum sp. PtaB.Bin013]|nr:MAG: hypothetical protein A4E52_01589 [Pelotomaculum sp. PtaB.Bin013]